MGLISALVVNEDDLYDTFLFYVAWQDWISEF